MFLQNLESTGFSVQVKKRKKKRRPSWISDPNDFSYFDLQVTPMLPSKFRVNRPFGSGEEAKNRFSKWPPWRPSNFRLERVELILIFALPRCFLPSFRSVGLLVQEKKRKTDFEDSRHSGHLGFPIETILFLIYKSPRCFLPSFESVGLLVQENNRKIYFQEGIYCGHLGFSNGRTLAIFDLQVTPMLPTKFRVDWLFGSGE